ncbi:hypothetical protein [Thiocystis violacea]|uniref:hypothetical protein n=1 Tax=Thiocystis violacea TaxID=13725 RepID=UPI00190454AF|nr:hypothetical protein [Thiocystis violacea]MBK1724523.1 hypothetical protein [Thiocystis violacea]
MQIEVDVSVDGVLTARLPKRFRGKHVRVSIEEEGESGRQQWNEICEVLASADQLDLPQRTQDEIQHDLSQFRESPSTTPP